MSNFHRLPESVQKRIAIENDDSSYLIKDVLYQCR
ncbi:MAG: hypothetical protein KAX49_14590 [Halanaerobiales bacterium]|nr:hypothetical protein [Halanaerobiales bacterium]